MGAGTKLPHNVMGLIGVANSSDGDLRPGFAFTNDRGPWSCAIIDHGRTFPK